MKKIILKQKKHFFIIVLITAMFAEIMIPLQSYSQNDKSQNGATLKTAEQIENIKKPKTCGSYTIDTAALRIAGNYEALHAGSLATINYTIQVYFHICRNDNGTNAAATETQVKSEFNDLVSDYAPDNICFINMGLNYINNSPINNMSTINSALLQPFLVPNCINVFYQKSVAGYGGNAYNIPNTFCSIVSGNIGAGHTTSHEVGHCLGLMHTFEPGYGYEKINGSNSATTGDKITDTPADPYAYHAQTCYAASGCSYTGNCTDPDGASNFSPPYSNIMAYWPIELYPCYTSISFSTGQFTRVNSFLNTNSSLQNCLSYPSVILNPSNQSSGYLMISSIAPLTTNGAVSFTGTSIVTLGGQTVILSPGFHSQPSAGGLLLVRTPSCGPGIMRNGVPLLEDEIKHSFNSNELICYPNPFSDKMTVRINLTKDDNLFVSLFDLMGKKVKPISDSYMTEGTHDMTIDASDLPAGIYFIMLKGTDFKLEKKIIKVN